LSSVWGQSLIQRAVAIAKNFDLYALRYRSACRRNGNRTESHTLHRRTAHQFLEAFEIRYETQN
jgi:hypothetical protein